MPARSTCRYVRLNALNVPHVLQPRFITPDFLDYKIVKKRSKLVL